MQTFLMMLSGNLIGIGMCWAFGWRPNLRNREFAELHALRGWAAATEAVRRFAVISGENGQTAEATTLLKAAAVLKATKVHVEEVNS
jgi:hypothetical protein